MRAKIIFYKQDNLDQNAKFKLRRELLGIRQKSNFSRYEYKVKGLLDNIPNYRPIKSSIIVENKNIKQIKDKLMEFNVKHEIFDIELPKKKKKK